MRSDFVLRLLACWRHPYAPHAVEALLVLALGWMTVDFTLRLLAPPPMPAAPSLGTASPETGQDALQRILKAHLFGKAEQKGAPSRKASPPPRLAPKVHARLVGVVAGTHPAAIIAVRGKEQVFFVGDELAPGVRVAAIGDRYAMLDRGGVMQRLQLERAPAQATGSPMPAAKAPVRAAARPAPRARVMPKGWVNRQLRDLPRLLTQARVVPHFKDGKADGFLITNIVPGSVYEQIGLQNGDIIKRVNGQAITTPQQAMAMYQSLQQSAHIDLTIERGGQELQLSYDLR